MCFFFLDTLASPGGERGVRGKEGQGVGKSLQGMGLGRGIWGFRGVMGIMVGSGGGGGGKEWGGVEKENDTAYLCPKHQTHPARPVPRNPWMKSLRPRLPISSCVASASLDCGRPGLYGTPAKTLGFGFETNPFGNLE